MVSCRSRTLFWIAGGSCSSRSMLLIEARLFPTAGRDLVVGEAEVLDELLVRGGLFEWVELLALEVLDQRLLERGAVVGLAHECRDRLQPDPARRPPASLPGDQLEAVARRRARARAAAARPRGSSRPATRASPRRSCRAADTGWAGSTRWRSPGARRPRLRCFPSPPGGISAPSPLPSPLGRATAHLLGQLAVRARRHARSSRTR